jgi:hypothetical protein
MTIADEPSPSPQPTVIEYAGPELGRRHRFKHVAAIVFAVSATLLGVLFVLNAIGYYGRSVAEPTTKDKELFLWDSAQFLVCSLVLLAPAFWYGRIGFRGEPRARR